MKKTILFITLVLIANVVLAQRSFSNKGDRFYFELKFEKAVIEYNKIAAKQPLTKEQQVNLADSYYKIKNYKKAYEIYNRLYQDDNALSTSDYNKLLQCLLKTKGVSAVKQLMQERKDFFSETLLNNAISNFDLLENYPDSLPVFTITKTTINSRGLDFAPAFYNDFLLYTSSKNTSYKTLYEPANEPFLDIYQAELSANGKLSNSKLFALIPNSPFHEATPHYAVGLQQVFYSASNKNGKNLEFNSEGINAMSIKAVQVNKPNSAPRTFLKDLGVSFYYPFYDAENSILYFCANLPDSYGGTDIYYVFINSDQIMSKPINLGPNINTPGNEVAPYVFNNELYFSSDIFYGLGGMDVYKAPILEELKYGPPVNLGPTINTAFDEFGFIIKKQADNKYFGFLSSNRKGGLGKDDIYGFTLIK